MADREPRASDESAETSAPRYAALDPGLQAQFERKSIVHDAPTNEPRADALQWLHYEPPAPAEPPHTP